MTVTFKDQNIGATFDVLAAWGDIAAHLDDGEDYPDLYGVPFEEVDDPDKASEEAKALLAKHQADLKPDTVAVLQAVAAGKPVADGSDGDSTPTPSKDDGLQNS